MPPKSKTQKQLQEQLLKEQEQLSEELRIQNNERYLRQTGLPRTLWNNTSIPDSIIGSPTGLPIKTNAKFRAWWDHVDTQYEEGNSFLVGGGIRDNRMAIVSAMALRVRQFKNKFPRDAVGFKHNTPLIHATSGEQLSYPYTFQFMDVEDLLSLSRERSNATRFNNDERHEPSFKEVVVLPDFFFLIEVGRERAWDSTAKIIEDLLYARSDEGLPTVMSFSKKASLVTNDNDVKVYENISSIITQWDGVGM